MSPDHIKDRPLIVIDPGHGGSDPGAVNDYIEESELNLDLALVFLLQARSSFDVLLTRKNDKAVSLPARAEIANAANPAAFLSFHCNASDNPHAHGFEVWTTPGQTKADALASAIFGAVLKACPTLSGRTDYDDGDPDREARFYVLRHTKAPAVLIEFGFISNDDETGWLMDTLNQFTLTAAVLDGVKRWIKET
jgi:N-acetylmuramoyl-L-alanine amidase